MNLKTLAATVLGNVPALNISLALYKKYPLVVLYHGVTAGTKKTGIENYRGKHVSVQSFEKQIDWLSKHFTIVPLRTIESLCLNKQTPTTPLCAITFDDGYRNNYLNAHPILQKKNIPATLFITTGFIERSTALWPDLLEESIGNIEAPSVTIPWSTGDKEYRVGNRSEKISADQSIRSSLKRVTNDEREKIINYLQEITHTKTVDVLAKPDYAPLAWNEVVAMSQSIWSIGAHTESHPILGRETAEKQQEEISLSVEKIRSKIGHCEHFAYPNGQPGDWTGETVKALERSGFATAWTTAGRRVSTAIDNPFELPRITLDNTENINRFRALAGNAIPFLRKLKK